MVKAVLFDMDGVLNLYPTTFSRAYAEREGIDHEPLKEFFATEWADVLTGKKDLKELLVQYKDAWQLKTTPENLLNDWFRTEERPNDELLAVVARLRKAGIKCYLATNNEKYRVEFIANHTFVGQLDGIFSSAGLGVMKPDPVFFLAMLRELNAQPEEVVFFDDSDEHVQAAQSLGITSYLYESVEQVKGILKV